MKWLEEGRGRGRHGWAWAAVPPALWVLQAVPRGLCSPGWVLPSSHPPELPEM